MPSLPSRALRRSASDPSFSSSSSPSSCACCGPSTCPAIEVSAAATSRSARTSALLATRACSPHCRLRGAAGRCRRRWLLAAAAAFAALIVVSSLAERRGRVRRPASSSSSACSRSGCGAHRLDRSDCAALLVLVVVVSRRRGRSGRSSASSATAAGQAAVVPRRARPRRARDAGARGRARGAVHARRRRSGPARAHCARRRRGRRRSLGAALASLLGLYLAAGVVLALARRARRPRAGAPLLATLAVAVVVDRGTLALRSGDLGFLQSWFGPQPEQPGPVRGELEPAPDLRLHRRPRLPRPAACSAPAGTASCRRRSTRATSRTRASASPTSRRTTSRPRTAPSSRSRPTTRCCYELGLVGVALFARCSLLALAAGVARGSLAARRRDRARSRTSRRRGWPPSLGALAGAALFGGTPLAALFWLTLGVVAASAGSPRRAAAVNARRH